MTTPLFTPSLPLIPLDAFANAAESNQQVYVVISGGNPVVQSGVDNSDAAASDAHTIAMFAQALAQRYGPGVARAVALELGLESRPGKALPAAIVAAAIDMAEVSFHALSGVDFMTRLAISAAGNTPAFLRACQEAGVAPSTLDATRRAELDQAMEARFGQAVRSGLSPVSPATAADWLRDLLRGL